jgi:hypothetical protein
MNGRDCVWIISYIHLLTTLDRMDQHKELMNSLKDCPYSGIARIALSRSYMQLGYPDLAAGEAYMALLLSDEVQDESGEYHLNAKQAAIRDIDSEESDDDAVLSWTRSNIEGPA